MRAMILKDVSGFAENPAPLVPAEAPEPAPRKSEILIRVAACGVCHTEIDEIEGRTPPPAFPVIPGHQVVGRVARRDIAEFLELAADIPLRPEVEEYPLAEASRALAELKAGKIRGAKVLRIA